MWMKTIDDFDCRTHLVVGSEAFQTINQERLAPKCDPSFSFFGASESLSLPCECLKRRIL